MNEEQILEIAKDVIKLEELAEKRAWDKSESLRLYSLFSKWKYKPSMCYGTFNADENCVDVTVAENTTHDYPDDIFMQITFHELAMSDSDWNDFIKHRNEEAKRNFYATEKAKNEEALKEKRRQLKSY